MPGGCEESVDFPPIWSRKRLSRREKVEEKMSDLPELEIVFLEDPACSWCWAFQPVQTSFFFEFGDVLSWRSVMGGLRDHPVPDVTLIMRHWETAANVSGMPFEPTVWQTHVLETTYTACRAVKAASIRSIDGARRLLRRMREAFYVERSPIDSLDLIFDLATQLDLNVEDLLEQIANGRAESLFAVDRDEASKHGFGYPTIVIRRQTMEAPAVLEGAVGYREFLDALSDFGVPSSARRRFHDTPADWDRLLELQPRITWAEIKAVTSCDDVTIRNRIRDFGLVEDGPFVCREIIGEGIGPFPSSEAVISDQAPSDEESGDHDSDGSDRANDPVVA